MGLNLATQDLVFIGMVFAAVFALAQGLIVPVFGEARQAEKRLRRRLQNLQATGDGPEAMSLLREKYLKQLSPLERAMESLPGMEALGALIEHSGSKVHGYRVVLLALVCGVAAAVVVFGFTRMAVVAAPAGLIVAMVPFLKLRVDRAKRLALFEEQLPEAIDVIKRALRAGHPFSESLHLVADEMPEPIASEFGATFAEINYRGDVRRALLGLLERIPSVTVMALVTSVMVQKETGGNLAEILDRIGAVIRGRFRLHRKVRTLSAEGRLSAWILAMVPFGLFIAISVTTPTYLPTLVEEPLGRKLVGVGFLMMIVGVFWIRRIIRIEV